MRKICHCFIFIGIVVVLLMPLLMFLGHRFLKLVDESYSLGNMGSYFAQTVFFLSYFYVSGKSNWEIIRQKHFNTASLMILIESLLMVFYLMASLYLFLKLVPIGSFSELRIAIWPISFIWFLVLSASAIFWHVIFEKKPAV